MSQIEQNFREFLNANPEIESCYNEGLINRRSLARYLVKNHIAKSNQLEALVAMLRRFPFKKKIKQNQHVFKDIKITVKDKIIILNFEKEKELIKSLQALLVKTNYDKNDTLKIVVGTSSVKVFIDKENLNIINSLFERFKTKEKARNVSEISIQFTTKVIETKGILSTLTKEFALNEIVINELLTANPELLIYVEDKFILKAYEILKRLQKGHK
jgi:hypothetical protein